VSATEHTLNDGQKFSLLSFGTDVCPTCEQTVPPEKLALVKGRLAAREDAIEKNLTKTLSAKFAQDREEMQRQVRETEQRAAAALAQEKHDAADREATIREEMARRISDEVTRAVADQTSKTAAEIAQMTEQLRAGQEERVGFQGQLNARQAELVKARESIATAEARTREAVEGEQQLLHANAVATLEATHKSAILAEAAGKDALCYTNSALREELASAHATTERAVAGVRQECAERESLSYSALTQARSELQVSQDETQSARQQLAETAEAQAREISQVVQETRDALEKDKIDAVNAAEAKFFNERQGWTEKVTDLQRKLEQKSADELGEGAELDIFERLKAEFPSDLITRVKKGTPGADIIQEIRENGVSCGKIVYDSKNRKDWKTEYATKLRIDQLSEKADHAVLSTNKLPAGTKQLHIYDHVIVACPARVLVVASLLRDSVVSMHVLRISNEAREDKVQALYVFMTSPLCAQHFDAINSQLTTLERIDDDEMKRHHNVWDKRGAVIKALERANGAFRYQVHSIIGGTAETDDDGL
jgi:hypothetical protein